MYAAATGAAGLGKFVAAMARKTLSREEQKAQAERLELPVLNFRRMGTDLDFLPKPAWLKRGLQQCSLRIGALVAGE